MDRGSIRRQVARGVVRAGLARRVAMETPLVSRPLLSGRNQGTRELWRHAASEILTLFCFQIPPRPSPGHRLPTQLGFPELELRFLESLREVQCFSPARSNRPWVVNLVQALIPRNLRPSPLVGYLNVISQLGPHRTYQP